MTKLNDTQRTILATAGGRESGLVLPLPKSLKLNLTKATPILQTMIEGGLLVERPALDGETVWRTDEARGKLTVVVTADGLSAVGIGSGERDSTDGGGSAVPRKARGRSEAPIVTVRPSKRSAAKGVGTTTVKPAASPDTKLGTLIKALRSKKGATIRDMTDADRLAGALRAGRHQWRTQEEAGIQCDLGGH